MAKDAAGNVVYDPSKNVLDLVSAALRLVDAKLEHQSEVVTLRAEHNAEIGRLRADHAKELRQAESSRLDAIRQVDVLGIQTLAQTTKDTAEAIRLTVEAKAEAMASQTAALMAGVNDRLSVLERSNYEGKGKEAVSDPMMVELLQEVKSLRLSQAAGTGRSGGLQMGWGVVIQVVSLVGALLAIYFSLK